MFFINIFYKYLLFPWKNIDYKSEVMVWQQNLSVYEIWDHTHTHKNICSKFRESSTFLQLYCWMIYFVLVFKLIWFCHFVFAEKNSDMQSFMLNLLVTCLIDKNGLEELMEESLSKVKFKKRGSDEYLVPSNTLSILLKELFLVTTLAALDNQRKGEFLSQKQNRNILKVLLKYQRLLFARIFLVTEKDLCWPARCRDG